MRGDFPPTSRSHRAHVPCVTPMRMAAANWLNPCAVRHAFNSFGARMIAHNSHSETLAQDDFAVRPKTLAHYRRDVGKRSTKTPSAKSVSQGMVSDFLAGKKGAGVVLIRALERLTSSSVLSVALQRGLHEPCPSRAVVATLARGEGAPSWLVDARLADPPPPGGDPGVEHWRARLIELDKLRALLATDLSRQKQG